VKVALPSTGMSAEAGVIAESPSRSSVIVTPVSGTLPVLVTRKL
jgi:hypothetical protein